jgi:uncharacterized protein
LLPQKHQKTISYHPLSPYHLFRQVTGVRYLHERISTPDGDFVDLDRFPVEAARVAIVAHGLEGNSTRPYVLGMVRALNRHGWDAVVWNFRGCSGEPNNKVRSYHSGDTPDPNTVLTHVLEGGRYAKAALIGFSLGGNVILKYLGEVARQLNPIIRAAVVFSVSCGLASSALKMARPQNTVYMKRFMRLLHEKIRAKMAKFPGKIDDCGYDCMRTFQDFDERYTAPLHGFKSAKEYWKRASSKPFLTRIAVPTLLVNVLDDPFLALPCYPYQEARANPFLFLETPKVVGHVGFVSLGSRGDYWSESRALEFLAIHAW